jgi:hypothetical protein
MALCESVLKGNTLPLNPAQFMEGLNETSFESGATLRSGGARVK